MDVSVSELRGDLAAWLCRVKDGEDVVVTDRGVPVARISPVESSSLLERLTREGVLSAPVSTNRPRAASTRRVRASGPVADLVGEDRR